MEVLGGREGTTERGRLIASSNFHGLWMGLHFYWLHKGWETNFFDIYLYE